MLHKWQKITDDPSL